MKSGKQRRLEIKAHRLERAKKRMRLKQDEFSPNRSERIPVDASQLAPTNSYGIPLFYEDLAFTCRDCGKEELWTAKQQKWWHEVAKGNIDSTAVRCRACRKVERERKAEARRVHLEGVASKRARLELEDSGFAVVDQNCNASPGTGPSETG